MGLFSRDPTPAPPAPVPVRQERVEVCVACRRSGVRMVPLMLPGGFGIASACTDTTDCRHHWPAESLLYGTALDSPGRL